MTIVYVELLDEGVDVWRPVDATHVGGGSYRLNSPVPEDEHWAFQPGEVVECRWRGLSEGKRELVAITKADVSS